ncbi:unnamed protein product [Cylicostephanus goldi]|uniref:Uncharacterized protein n=1 Tax=Cylicostephanus goldi TaxID=71465 RepID=A0A3P6R9Q9_CYLGO|nr:unnamed protein product [Cylicostephanus goldi]
MYCDPRFVCKEYRCVPKPKWRAEKKLLMCKKGDCEPPTACVDNFCLINMPCRTDYDCGDSQLKCIQSICAVPKSTPAPLPQTLGSPGYTSFGIPCQNGVCKPPLSCIDNFCVRGTPCTVGVECNGYPRFECKQQNCVPKLQWRPNNSLIMCKDAICPASTICINNFCLRNLRCQNDHDCGSPLLKCVQSICEDREQFSPTLPQHSNPEMPRPLTGSRSAVLGESFPGMPCQNGVCTSPYVCINDICIRGVLCTTNYDCRDSRFDCIQRNCIPGSKWRPDNVLLMCSNNLCPPSSTCVNNFCVNLMCRNDYDCGSPQMRCIQSACIVLSGSESQSPTASIVNPNFQLLLPNHQRETIPPTQLRSIGDCMDGYCPEPYVCIAGSCVTGQRCRVDSDCGYYSGVKCLKSLCIQVSLAIMQPPMVIGSQS